MTDSDTLPKSQLPLQPWLHLAAVVLSLGIFVATYFAYFLRHEARAGGSSWSLAVGAGSFFLLMCALAYFGSFSSSLRRRIAKAAGIALVDSVVFVLLLLFLVVNTFGA